MLYYITLLKGLQTVRHLLQIVDSQSTIHLGVAKESNRVQTYVSQCNLKRKSAKDLALMRGMSVVACVCPSCSEPLCACVHGTNWTKETPRCCVLRRRRVKVYENESKTWGPERSKYTQARALPASSAGRFGPQVATTVTVAVLWFCARRNGYKLPLHPIGLF